MKWEVEILPYQATVVNEVNEPVARIIKSYYAERNRTQEADEIALLIRAAPQMLEALEAVQEATKGWVMSGYFWDAMFRVHTAVRLAKGVNDAQE